MSEQQPIPNFGSLAEIYPSEPAVLREGSRWNALCEKFKATYGDLPTHVIRAPGRVNILGEHIDYSLFPVLPAAIEQDILIALHPRSSPTVRLGNFVDSFKSTTFDLTHQKGGQGWHVDFISPKDGGGWDNYVKVALQEGLEEYFKLGKSKDGLEPKGMDLLVSGVVPPGAGLSSSAAFVVASSIVFLVANNLTQGVTKGDVVGMAMASEHRMGLRTGGMDQAASALCLSNTLLHLSFYPSLKPIPLPLPPALAVVITNSLAVHELTTGAPEQYNLRVVEGLIATRLLLHSWGLDKSPELKGKIGAEGRVWLRTALDMWAATLPASTSGIDSSGSGGVGHEVGSAGGEVTLSGMDEKTLYEKGLEEVDRVLGHTGKGEKGWTKEEMIEASGMSVEDFTETFLNFLEIRATYFHLHRRLKHTLLESLRVLEFSNLCHSLPSSISESDPAMNKFGQLINASHMSCKDIYDCTVPTTDRLQQLCVKNGAVGARQTGGGWGGAVISLVKLSEVDGFVEKMKNDWDAYKGLSEEEKNQCVFATLPGSGAGIYTLDGPVA